MATSQPVAVLAAPWCTLLMFGVWLRWQCSSAWPTSIDLQRIWWGGWSSVVAMAIVAISAQWLVKTPRQSSSRAWWAVPSACALLAVGLQLADCNDLANKQLLGRFDLHARADLGYLAAVAAELSDIQDHVQHLDESQRELLDRLDASLVRWTQHKVVNSNELPTQLAALRILAFDIYPRATERAAVERFVTEEIQQITERAQELRISQQQLQSELTRQSAELERLHGEDVQSDGDTSVAATRSAVAASVTRLETELQSLKSEQQGLDGRLALRQEIPTGGAGLNRRYRWLKLPACIPGGQWWSWTFVAFSSLHIVYAVVGVCITIGWRCHSTESHLSEWTYKLRFLRMYWTIAAVGVALGYFLV